MTKDVERDESAREKEARRDRLVFVGLLLVSFLLLLGSANFPEEVAIKFRMLATVAGNGAFLLAE